MKYTRDLEIQIIIAEELIKMNEYFEREEFERNREI